MNNLALVPGFIVNAITLSWIFDIEKKCGCSDDWRRDYMKYYIIMAFVMVFALLASKPNMATLKYIVPPLFVAMLVYIYSVLTYIQKLNKTKCTCATLGDWRDDFIYWIVLISFVLQLVGAIVLVAVLK